MKISIQKGLDVPLKGKPTGPLKPLPSLRTVALPLDAFENLRFKVLTKVGEKVKIGQPLVENKGVPGHFFVSPAGGTVKEIRRGLKRRLLGIVIDVDEKEEVENYPTLNPEAASKEEILSFLLRSGIFPHIRMRPFDLLATPAQLPRDIFVKAIESLPYVPSAETQVAGHEANFQTGLYTLSKLTTGKVHLVYSEKTESSAFKDAHGVKKHSATGPHPIGNSSTHIQWIAPIRSSEDCLWTLSVNDVIAVGKMMAEGIYHTDRVLSIAGSGILEGEEGLFQGRLGVSILDLMNGRILNKPVQLISGDPLVGHLVQSEDYLGFYETTFSALLQNTDREPFHFLKLGGEKYSFHRAYLTGHFKSSRTYSFTTNQHGEERAFIDGSIYDKVMPLRIPTMNLIKALLAEDFDLAVQLGLLEVAPEDFALASFICPSKIEMIDIVQQGIDRFSKEMGY